MTPQESALLVLSIEGTVGIILIIIGMLLRKKAEQWNASCTDMVKGKVTRYCFTNEDEMFPVIQFMVNGQIYETRKEFEGYHVVNSPFVKKAEAYEDERGVFHLKEGVVTDTGRLAEELWPLGSEMDVYYNPENPDINYAERPVRKNFTASLLIAIGAGVIVMGIVMYFVVLKNPA
ncbi:MAG: hypothetical protein VZT48_12375 [Bulleidia sp.]|nr:hypothetical protein [Bulleidia sp.]